MSFHTKEIVSKIKLFHTGSGIDFNLYKLFTSLIALKYLKATEKALSTYLNQMFGVTVLSFCSALSQQIIMDARKSQH